MQQTPNYNLPQFEGNDFFNKEDLNDAFYKIDEAISDLQETINNGNSNGLSIIQEVIEARKGKEKLVDKINEIEDSLYDFKLSLGVLTGLIINIKDFGAKGDGITDDTDIIQTCINKVCTGGVLYIPNGTYMIKGVSEENKTYSEDVVLNSVLGLKLHSNMTILLESDNAILKMIPNSSSTSAILNIQNCNNITVIGGTIDGNKDNQTLNELSTPAGQIEGYWNDQWRSGCLIYGANENIDFHNVRFVNSVGDGVMCHTFNTNNLPVNITANNCLFDKCGRTGFHVGGGKNYVIKNSKFTNINKQNTNTCKISNIGVDVEANWIYLEQVLVDNCTFDNVENGVLANYCKDNVTISNCTFKNSTYHDIECREGLEQINLYNNTLTSSLNLFSDNVFAYNNKISKLNLYGNVKTGTNGVCKNVVLKDNLIGQTTVWTNLIGDNYIFDGNIFNYTKTVQNTFGVNSCTITNITFKNNTFNCGSNSNILINGDVSNDENYIVFEDNTFNGKVTYNTQNDSQLYNYKNVKLLRNTFNNLNALLGFRVYTTNSIYFFDNLINYDNSDISVSNNITSIKLETKICKASNNNFISQIGAITRGLYVVNTFNENNTCVVNNNTALSTEFTTPIGYYKFTNVPNATNII